jgi:hypothetical protein
MELGQSSANDSLPPSLRYMRVRLSASARYKSLISSGNPGFWDIRMQMIGGSICYAVFKQTDAQQERQWDLRVARAVGTNAARQSGTEFTASCGSTKTKAQATSTWLMRQGSSSVSLPPSWLPDRPRSWKACGWSTIWRRLSWADASSTNFLGLALTRR